MAMMYGGMLYFPLKVNLFEEIAIELIEARFGLKGTAVVMKLMCKIYKENGYYLRWESEQCTLFTNKVGRDVSEEEMQGIIDILVKKGFFDQRTYEEKQVLTSLEIQKVWLEATKRRKRDLNSLPYIFEELKGKPENAKEEEADIAPGCIQNQENCRQDVDNLPENAYNSGQSKESKESKAKESRELPPQSPPGEDGGMAGISDLEIPGYAYNKKTHNLECLLLSLQQLHITDREEIKKILRLSDYGRLGGVFWKIYHDTNWSRVNCKGGYLISVLVKERKTTRS